MIAYKLFRKMPDGYAPLFINKRQRLEVGVAYQAEDHQTKGYAHRPGWHACLKPEAPHLSEKDRVWCEVELDGCTIYNRPANQGGQWVLADKLTIIREL